jgi:Domain of unknown function (DUF4397)
VIRLRKQLCAVVPSLLCFGLLAFALACGGSSTKIRLVNASPDESSIDLLVDSKTVASSVTYATASAYQGVSSGNRHLQVEPTGSTSPIIDETVSLSSGSFSLLATGFVNDVVPVLLTDNNSAPPSGDANVRLVNAAPGLGSADVYLVAPGTDLSTVSPTVASLAVNSASAYQSVAAGNYEVFFTLPGQKFVYIDSGSLALSASQIRTVMGLNSPTGGFTSAVLSDAN